jgi:predicted nuclease of predicted toxin-antitoxin system
VSEPSTASTPLWIDAQLSPALAPFVTDLFGAALAIEASSVKWLGLRDATDEAIYAAAREAGAIVLTKDADFAVMLERHGPPPCVIWVTLGNTSNARMREVLRKALPEALSLLRSGEALVEIGETCRDRPG